MVENRNREERRKREERERKRMKGNERANVNLQRGRWRAQGFLQRGSERRDIERKTMTSFPLHSLLFFLSLEIDLVLRAEIQHGLSFPDPADQRAGELPAIENEGKRLEGSGFGGGPHKNQRAVGF